MAVRFCSKPVVTAPAGRTLGGGAEVSMAGARTVAAAETYMGLVEVGVGLFPARVVARNWCDGSSHPRCRWRMRIRCRFSSRCCRPSGWRRSRRVRPKHVPLVFSPTPIRL